MKQVIIYNNKETNQLQLPETMKLIVQVSLIVLDGNS